MIRKISQINRNSRAYLRGNYKVFYASYNVFFPSKYIEQFKKQRQN